MVQAPPTASVRPSRSSLNQASGSSETLSMLVMDTCDGTCNNALSAKKFHEFHAPNGYSAGL